MFLPLLFVMAMPPPLQAQQPQQEVKVDPVCTADIRWAVTGPQITGRAASDQRLLTLFSTVAQPMCEPAEIRLTVAYFDAAEELVCGGVVPRVAVQADATLLTTLEFHLTNLAEWVRWRSGPHDVSLQTRPLACINADATGQVSQVALDRATSLRLYATILTPNRGMATAELRLAIQPGVRGEHP